MTTSAVDTDQLRFWRGEFGRSYIERNPASAEHLGARVALWAKILERLINPPPKSILEVGANIGNNIRALRTMSGAEMYAVEPIPEARQALVSQGVLDADKVFDACAAKIPLADGAVDLAFTSGVLIHIHPDQLLQSCREIYRVARRYIVCIEYFSDKPEMIPYRGHADRLFKRDFGGFYLDNFPDLQVVDYGFAWKRVTGIDNATWWAFAKPE